MIRENTPQESLAAFYDDWEIGYFSHMGWAPRPTWKREENTEGGVQVETGDAETSTAEIPEGSAKNSSSS